MCVSSLEDFSLFVCVDFSIYDCIFPISEARLPISMHIYINIYILINIYPLSLYVHLSLPVYTSR